MSLKNLKKDRKREEGQGLEPGYEKAMISPAYLPWVD